MIFAIKHFPIFRSCVCLQKSLFVSPCLRLLPSAPPLTVRTFPLYEKPDSAQQHLRHSARFRARCHRFFQCRTKPTFFPASRIF
jgi:hypothetical protein